MSLSKPSLRSCQTTQRLHHAPASSLLTRTVRSNLQVTPPTPRWHSTQKCAASQPTSSSSPYSKGNLGVLSSEIQVSTGDESWALQRVSAESFRNQGLYFDPATIVTSTIVLLLLLAISFQRVLGLDRFVAQALADWKERREEERRREIMDARQSLQEGWTEDGEAGNSKGPKP